MDGPMAPGRLVLVRWLLPLAVFGGVVSWVVLTVPFREVNEAPDGRSGHELFLQSTRLATALSESDDHYPPVDVLIVAIDLQLISHELPPALKSSVPVYAKLADRFGLWPQVEAAKNLMTPLAYGQPIWWEVPDRPPNQMENSNTLRAVAGIGMYDLDTDARLSQVERSFALQNIQVGIRSVLVEGSASGYRTYGVFFLGTGTLGLGMAESVRAIVNGVDEAVMESGAAIDEVTLIQWSGWSPENRNRAKNAYDAALAHIKAKYSNKIHNQNLWVMLVGYFSLLALFNLWWVLRSINYSASPAKRGSVSHFISRLTASSNLPHWNRLYFFFLLIVYSQVFMGVNEFLDQYLAVPFWSRVLVQYIVGLSPGLCLHVLVVLQRVLAHPGEK